jgi:hypothetical protein
LGLQLLVLHQHLRAPEHLLQLLLMHRQLLERARLRDAVLRPSVQSLGWDPRLVFATRRELPPSPRAVATRRIGVDSRLL